MKSPKEEAEELFNKYLEINSHYYQARDCALIAIEEVLKYSKAHGFIGLTEEYEQVKNEIEKL
jgi:predicted GNAT family N-acyltransferase